MAPPADPIVHLELVDGKWYNPSGDGLCGPACVEWIHGRVGVPRRKEAIAEEMSVSPRRWMNSRDLSEWVKNQSVAYFIMMYTAEQTPTNTRHSPRAFELKFCEFVGTQGASKVEVQDVPVYGIVSVADKHFWVFDHK